MCIEINSKYFSYFLFFYQYLRLYNPQLLITLILYNMKNSIFTITLIASLFFTLTSFAQTEDQAPRERLILESTEGTVTAINSESRELTLMGADGSLVTITASEAIERFDEIAVNDIVAFDYWTYMMAEFREPTAEELEEPIVMLTDASLATEDMDPGAAVGAIVKAVVTIEALNRPFMLATVQGPLGNFLTIPMEDEELIQQLHIGQVLILTYAEAVAITLEKIGSVETIED